MNTSTTQDIEGQESWSIGTKTVTAAVTVNGAMAAPVRYTLPDGRTVKPYYVNPWNDESPEKLATIDPPVLRPLRGDFFCLPFGAANAVGDEDHQPHGESAWARWHLIEADADSLTLERKYEACPGTVRRKLTIGTDAPWMLSRHTVTGFSGAYPLGMHATLHGSENFNTWTIQTAPFAFGMVDPEFVPPYAGGEYTSLEPGAVFNDLTRVPTRWKNEPWADCSHFPARHGFVDIITIYRKSDGRMERAQAQSALQRIAWTVAINNEEGYLWYSLKDASVLPATVLWMENGGRHGAPWSGRNSCIGIEETCSFIASGRTRSIEGNAVNRRGVPTAARLSPKKPTVVTTLQGVLPLDRTDISVIELVETDGTASAPWAFVLSDGTTLPLNAPVQSVVE